MRKVESNFEPKIVGFLCKWCAYTGADLAGTSRIKYPPNVTPIRVMCSGRVDPVLVMKALSSGADGVLIAGCHPGDCHYTSGNVKTIRRFKLLQKMLDQFGVERHLRINIGTKGETLTQGLDRIGRFMRRILK